MDKPRNKLKEKQVDFIIDNWDEMSEAELAEECGCSTSTIASWAREIRKETDGELCPPKEVHIKKRVDIIKNVLQKRKEAKPARRAAA